MAGLDQARIVVAGNDDTAFGVVDAVDHTRARNGCQFFDRSSAAASNI